MGIDGMPDPNTKCRMLLLGSYSGSVEWLAVTALSCFSLGAHKGTEMKQLSRAPVALLDTATVEASRGGERHL